MSVDEVLVCGLRVGTHRRTVMKGWGRAVLIVVALLLGSGALAAEEGPGEAKTAAPVHPSGGAATGAALAPGLGAAVERIPIDLAPGPCGGTEVVSQPSRPNWSSGAATTECGVLESDAGWLWQPVGGGVTQSILPTSVRYGLTPRMDLRWGLPAHITQHGGGTTALEGVSDQWLSTTYRFAEQGPRVPALAFSYGLKIPTANPQKGFGTGYVDHQLTLIASRDVGKAHFDFNTVGTLAGGAGAYDGAAQFGLALSVPVTKRLTGIVESDGGPQLGTAERFGQALEGGSFAMRPWLVLDCAYTRAYTAGSPRQQFTAGFTYARRPKVAVGLLGLGRLVGR
jgi:hypothetical protein